MSLHDNYRDLFNESQWGLVSWVKVMRVNPVHVLDEIFMLKKLVRYKVQGKRESESVESLRTNTHLLVNLTSIVKSRSGFYFHPLIKTTLW